ncbi:hypothetical protein FQN53_004147 [Emmonsiellopsis sp. PD_33]|nr:hypothetical protein FQN53_004147 [Emmonsiellopsis sp. PD_33]
MDNLSKSTLPHLLSKTLNLALTYPKTLTTLLVLGTPTIYFLRLHRQLSRKIQHSRRTGSLSSFPLTTNVRSIPAGTLTSPTRAVYDTATLSLPASSLPSEHDLPAEELLTHYLRRNMQNFSWFPQARLLRLTSRTAAEKQTFEPGYLQRAGFREGELICGIYTVVGRRGGVVEFELKPTGAMRGRLVISVERRGEGGDGEVVFGSETVMWKGEGEKGVLPLEVGLLRFLHEMAAWWLLVSGTGWLVENAGRLEKDK